MHLSSTILPLSHYYLSFYHSPIIYQSTVPSFHNYIFLEVKRSRRSPSPPPFLSQPWDIRCPCRWGPSRCSTALVWKPAVTSVYWPVFTRPFSSPLDTCWDVGATLSLLLQDPQSLVRIYLTLVLPLSVECFPWLLLKKMLKGWDNSGSLSYWNWK